MPTQYQIEQGAGIDGLIASHMMAEKTAHARNAMSLLKMCVTHYDEQTFGLLQSAVRGCRSELTPDM